MAATAEELKELVFLARESGDVDLEIKALEQFTSLQQPQDGGLMKQAGDAFLSIPGGAQLAEFASGFNKSVVDLIDFFGPDQVNAALQLAGSEKRIPTLGEIASLGTQGGFIEPGLQQQILRGAGEVSGLAAPLGGVIRSASARLPAALPSESTARGVLRQAGQTTIPQDVGFGALSGAGQEVGREVGGETGAAIGSIATPIAVAIPLAAAKTTATHLLRKKAAPSIEQLKKTASGIYKSLDESGVSIPAQSYNNLADDVGKILKREGLDPDITPKATAVLKRLQSEKDLPKTLTELDTLRKVAQNAANSPDASESRLGTLAINKIDDFLDDVPGNFIQGKETGAAFKSARDLWSRAKKAELLDRAIVDASNQASGFENGVRTQFRAMLKKINNKKLRGFTTEETDAIRQVVQGTKAGNVARFLGKFGILDGVTSRSLTTLGGAGLAGAATGNPAAAAAVPLIGQVSGALAERMTLNNAAMANAIIRSGRNSAKITNIYMKNTPSNKRSATELAELFLINKVPVDQFPLKEKPPLFSDAALIAAIAKFNDAKKAE